MWRVDEAPTPEPALFSAADVEARARARLACGVAPASGMTTAAVGGDHALDGAPLPSMVPRAAAVLVGIVAHPDGTTVLLTRRRDDLRHHAGQIAFPGGKVDPGDASPRAAALREAEEEIGLDPATVLPIGYLDPYLTGTGFMVVPTVALIRPPLRLVVNPDEVAEAFEVPLAFLMDPRNHQRHHKTFEGRSRAFYAMPFGERFIWGATAGILRSLFERLYAR